MSLSEAKGQICCLIQRLGARNDTRARLMALCDVNGQME